MSVFNDRILQIAEYYNIVKPADFAKMTGFSHQVASNYLKGTRVPNAEALYVIKQTFDISAEWLLTGEGDMLVNKESSKSTVIYKNDPRDIELIEANKELINTQKELITSLKQRINELERRPMRTSNVGLHSAHTVDSSSHNQDGVKPK